MKVAVMIPAHNEDQTIRIVLESIPKKIEHVESITTVLVDDGSTDRTIKEAQLANIDHVVKNNKKFGLARSFRNGISYIIENELADIIITTDGDNQYKQLEIPKLLTPLLEGQADMTIGDRQIWNLDHMPLSKKLGNIMGSWFIRLVTGSDIRDASSGFRAFTVETARGWELYSNHTYTHETIIQTILNNRRIVDVPISFKKRQYGSSRLIKGLYSHVKLSLATILRSILLYKAFKYLLTLGILFLFIGVLIGIRFLYFFIAGEGSGHIQSLIMATILINIGFMTFVLGVLADLIAYNRKLLREIKNKIT